MIPEHAVLGCAGYDVTQADGQVIFDESVCVGEYPVRFAFEKPRDINDTPGTWRFVYMDLATSIPATHIVQAYEWCCKHLGKNFQEGAKQ